MKRTGRDVGMGEQPDRGVGVARVYEFGDILALEVLSQRSGQARCTSAKGTHLVKELLHVLDANVLEDALVRDLHCGRDGYVLEEVSDR